MKTDREVLDEIEDPEADVYEDLTEQRIQELGLEGFENGETSFM